MSWQGHYSNKNIRMTMIRRMKIKSQDESDSGDPRATKKTRMLMTRRMIKGSQDKSNGKEHCNNEKTR